MRIFFENVNLNSTSGPNSFARKLVKYDQKIPLFQRLDGIYFNSIQNFNAQNSNINKTYNRAGGVIFQTQFNKDLTFKYFGEHENTKIIHNGADLGLISAIKPLSHSKLRGYDNVWACASKWRPHKRLDDNINYFLDHAGQNDCLVVAGATDHRLKNERIIYIGEVDQVQLLSLYKASKYFIHLAWLDHCPNVVVDARAAGCQIICSSTGGTKEVAGPDAVILQEEKWDFQPVRLYEPPKLDFSKKIKNSFDSDVNMLNVAKEYCDFLSR